MIPGAKFIYCADAGLGSYNIRKFNSMGGRAVIVTQSLVSCSEWVEHRAQLSSTVAGVPMLSNRTQAPAFLRRPCISGTDHVSGHRPATKAKVCSVFFPQVSLEDPSKHF